MRSLDPALTLFPGLVRCPLRCTFPPLIASPASWRVLKKRAAQSHLSRRMVAADCGLSVTSRQATEVVGSGGLSLLLRYIGFVMRW